MQGINDYDRDGLVTLMGVNLVNMAAGIITVWGSSNIYFLSYFR
jgi:hypothetical protein